MKAKTRIVTAAKDLYAVYTEYSRVILHIPVTAGYPHVTWKAGNTKQGARGTWWIDGHEYQGTADEVVARLEAATAHWADKLRRRSEPVIKQAPLPAESFTVENRVGGRKIGE